jgi:hypothetical protein
MTETVSTANVFSIAFKTRVLGVDRTVSAVSAVAVMMFTCLSERESGAVSGVSKN